MEKTPTTLPSGQGNQVTKIHDLLRDSACGHQPAERPATPAVYHQGHINKTCKPSPAASVMPVGAMNLHSMKPARPSKDSSPHPQASHHFQTGLGLLGNVWDGRRADHHRRLSWEYQQSNQYKYPIWDYSSYNTNSNAQVVYHSSPFKGDALEYQVTGPFLGDLGNFAGDFPMFLWELPQAPNFLVYTDISKPRLQSCSKNAAPNVCILALAMMIAGIPTVPVPGVREEDMIAAAQTFMEGKYEVYTGTECKWHTEGHPSHAQPYSM